MDELTTLSLANLEKLPGTVTVPEYARDGLTEGIVHIGLGNFHRAHQAWYMHRLMQQGLAHDWAIVGAGIRSYDASMRERLLAQDCLTTLVELDPNSTAVEVTGSMIDYAPVEEGNQALIARLASPSIRIASLTVTEGGYYRKNGRFDAEHPEILADLASPDRPATVFGSLTAALKLRRAAGLDPFTVMSCDNLQNNGDIVADTLISFARLVDQDLASWIEERCAFPNSMVDCIVPATGQTEMDLVHTLGIDDHAPVTHEPFRHWVIEDKFCAGRPPWEQVGAILTDNVHKFEAMKLRILNGGHQILANAGDLLSVQTIAGAADHPLIAAMFDKVEREEILPFVSDVPGFTPEAYLAMVTKRFRNPKIIDTTRRVAFDGASRHLGFLIPSLSDGLAAGKPVDGLALVEAIWWRYCCGVREDGTKIDPNDPRWDSLTDRATRAKADPLVWLDMKDVYGNLNNAPVFCDAFAGHAKRISSDGLDAAIAHYLGQDI